MQDTDKKLLKYINFKNNTLEILTIIEIWIYILN